MATRTANASETARGTAKQVVSPPLRTQQRLAKAGIDISNGYPYIPEKIPQYVQDVYELRNNLREYVDPATRADPEKKALFGAATKVHHLGAHAGTELVGVQLSKLTDQQKDELALLVAERAVVFLREPDISPQEQKELGLYLGGGEIEIYPQSPQVPGVGGGVSIIWPEGEGQAGLSRVNRDYRFPYGKTVRSKFGWHTDLVHEAFPPGYTHLHLDAIPEIGGDTLWASGAAAYDKLSPKFRSLIDGLK
ncbi:hypothetical protein I302_107215 [Kwoniella bestiolae CBS 10118]|uniref:TauD/TfdA-like domain-containing protein n=1 Tax=Kwoniella bestiolae CBS 10118 TaxID=1296100 RepID=A0AAJ8KD49_9TREE